MDRSGRHSIRLREYDYSQAGAYFVTICTFKKASTLGRVVDGGMCRSALGELVAEEWLRVAEQRPMVSLDEFIVMPNHFHAVLFINKPDTGRGMINHAPTSKRVFGKMIPDSLPEIILCFKAAVTRQANRILGRQPNPIWQRSYYEHVIRDEQDLNEIREYIVFNPGKWDLDTENPDRKPRRVL